jgi:chromate transporter
MPHTQDKLERLDSPWSVFLIFLRLGFTSFGGPIAHLAYFREEFVARRQWLSEQRYADLVALCQFLPGPASSQVGLAIGMQRAGHGGALAAWAGFTMPSAIILLVLALSLADSNNVIPAGVISGLKIVVVAVVAQAVWGMSKSLCPDFARRVLMISCATLLAFNPSVLTQIAVIIAGGFVGYTLYRKTDNSLSGDLLQHNNRKVGTVYLSLFLVLLVGLPTLALVSNSHLIDLFDTFYRVGSIVFGGGHVVLPLLQTETAEWLSNDLFLAGYGATQAVPGPLFTFSAFLGAAMTPSPNGIIGGVLCLVAIFLPSLLLVLGVLPFWERLRKNNVIQASLAGVNAAVVGILLAALYHPIWTSAIIQWHHLLLALLALFALMRFKMPPWLVVLACAFLGWIMQITQSFF